MKTKNGELRQKQRKITIGLLSKRLSTETENSGAWVCVDTFGEKALKEQVAIKLGEGVRTTNVCI